MTQRGKWQRQEVEGPAVPEPGCGRCLTRAHSKGGFLGDSNFQQVVYTGTLTAAWEAWLFLYKVCVNKLLVLRKAWMVLLPFLPILSLIFIVTVSTGRCSWWLVLLYQARICSQCHRTETLMRIQDRHLRMVGDVVLALRLDLILWVCARLAPPSHIYPYD